MTRPKLLAGNWKLYLAKAEATSLVHALIAAKANRVHQVVVAPVFTVLDHVAQLLAGSSIALAGQDLYHKERGAFTGEVSASMLKDVGCSMVIVGHSERRQYFGETNASVAEKTKAALAGGLIPIVCVGETLEQRESGTTLSVVQAQIHAVTAVLAPEHHVVFAYEPVWAIGTGKVAKPEDAQEVHHAIRGWLRDAKLRADEIQILYGGSVKPENAKDLMSCPDIDGALVGGASIVAEQFLGIIAACP